MDKNLALYSAQQSRDLDARAIGDFAIPGFELMQRAAQAAWQCLRSHWPAVRSIGVLVGPGNNGGDALEVARLAKAQGLAVEVFLLAEPDAFRGEAAQAWQAFCADGMTASKPKAIVADTCEVWVDGLFGSGLSRDVEGQAAEWIKALNNSACRVLALDVPSGLNADTGAVLGTALKADVCISFIARKQGLFTGEALDYVGHRVFDDLQLPLAVFDGFVPSAELMANIAVSAVLPARQQNAYKGKHGHVVLIGGAPGYSGAIRMAAGAALRGGAGLVSVITHPDSQQVVSLGLPDAMVHGALCLDAALQDLWGKADVIVIGPGLRQDEWGRYWLEQAANFSGAKVVDADGLNLLAVMGLSLSNAILTPHPGEAGRLLGVPTQQIQADRYHAVRELVATRGCVTVLKGAGSLVSEPGGDSWVCPAGNPGMAVAGMGDVLSGLMGALLAQAGSGVASFEMACAAVLAHAQAGDLLAREQGQRGLLASDVIQQLPRVLN